MLETLYLTKSKIRGRILGVLFSNPERPYYLSELARQVKTSPGNVRRELARFIQDGLIREERKGNLVFYHLNRSHALFSEINSLILKTTGIEGALQDLVKKDKKIKLALLYGSFARGEEHGESDIDLLVVSEGKDDDFYSKLSELETRFHREINPTIYSPAEFKEKLNEKGSFLAEVIGNTHHILKGSLDEFRKASSARSGKKT